MRADMDRAPPSPSSQQPHNPVELPAAMQAIEVPKKGSKVSTHSIISSAEKTNNIYFKGELQGHAGTVLSIAFSPDGHTLATASGDGAVKFWNAKTGVQNGSSQLQGQVDFIWCMVFSPDRHTLASGSDNGTLMLWEAETGSPYGPGRLQGPFCPRVNSIAFSPNGRLLACASRDGTIALFDTMTGKPQRFEGHRSPVLSIAFSPDGRWLFSGSESCKVKLWDLEDLGDIWRIGIGGKVWRAYHFQSPVLGIAVSPDGRTLASGCWDHTAWLQDMETAKQPQPRPLQGHTDAVCSVAFSPDGCVLASGSWDCTVRLWVAKTGGFSQPEQLDGHTGTVRSLAFSPDGCVLASGSEDGTIRLWSTIK